MRARRSLAILTASALLVVACGSGTDVGTEAVPPTEPPPPAPTPAPEPDPTPTPVPVAEPPALLVPHDGGVDLLSGDDVQTVLAGPPVDVALSDHRGGLVVQFAEEGPATIAWIPAVGDEPVVLDADPGALWRSLQQVAVLDGTPTAIYAEAVELPNECADEECRWDFQRTVLVAHGLVDGQRLVLGTVGSFESGGVSYAIGQEWTVLEATPYGSPASCIGMLPTVELLGAPWAERWIGHGSDVATAAVAWPLTGPCEGEQVEACGDDFCEVFVSAAIAPDGDTAAIAWAHRSATMVEENLPLDLALVTVATASGRELERMVLGGDAVPTWIDSDGSWTVLGRLEYGTGETMAPLLMGPDGEVAEPAVDGYACAVEGCPRLAIWSPPAA